MRIDTTLAACIVLMAQLVDRLHSSTHVGDMYCFVMMSNENDILVRKQNLLNCNGMNRVQTSLFHNATAIDFYSKIFNIIRVFAAKHMHSNLMCSILRFFRYITYDAISFILDEKIYSNGDVCHF